MRNGFHERGQQPAWGSKQKARDSRGWAGETRDGERERGDTVVAGLGGANRVASM